MSRIRTAGRAAAGLAALVPAALVVTGTLALPAPAPLLVGDPEAAVVSTRPSDADLICPGPVVPYDAAADDVAYGPQFAATAPAPAVDLRALAVSPESALLDGFRTSSATATDEQGNKLELTPPALTASSQGSEVELTTGTSEFGTTVAGAAGVSDLLHLSVAATETSAPVAAATQISITESGDWRAGALAECSPASLDQYLLGAGTQAGSSSRLEITNPHDRPAPVQLSAWGAEGRIDLGGQGALVVGPGETTTLLLESVAPGHDALGLRLESSGVPVAASLQTSTLDGLVPRGTDWLTPVSGPSTSARVATPAAGHASLRLLSESADPGSAEVTVAGPDGASRDPVTVELTRGVTAVDLGDLPAGGATVSVTADTPVVADVETSGAVGAEGASDLTHATAQPPLDGSIAVAFPGATGEHALLLGAGEDTEAVLVPVATDGTVLEPVTVAVPAATTTVAAAGSLADGRDLAGVVVVPAHPDALSASLTWSRDGGALRSVQVLRPAPEDLPASTVRLG